MKIHFKKYENIEHRNRNFIIRINLLLSLELNQVLILRIIASIYPQIWQVCIPGNFYKLYPFF